MEVAGVMKIQDMIIANSLEASKSDLQSLDFVTNRFFMKLSTNKSIKTVKYCQEYFDSSLPSVLWAKCVAKFKMSFECFLSVI